MEEGWPQEVPVSSEYAYYYYLYTTYVFFGILLGGMVGDN
jgi:hypothetical protein